jgi:tetratricopeptide (TPR) repeat protein
MARSPSRQEIDAIIALFGAARYAEAATLAQTLTARFPREAFGWKALGAAWKELGWLDDALAPMQKAVALLPGDAEAHTNLGNVLNDLGRLEEAAAAHRRALKIRPGLAEAHYNLGCTLADQGRLSEAEASYEQALRIRPDFVDALNNSAFVLNAQGEPTLALDRLRRSLAIRESDKAREFFVDCVKGLRFASVDAWFRELLARALSEPWGRPSELARVAIDVIKLAPEITDGPLLRAVLESAPVCDIELERFLTATRHRLLEAAAGAAAQGGESGAALGFHCALARQCFVNEYVFFCAEQEGRQARDLRDRLAAALEAKKEVPVLWLAAVAAYFPLHGVPNASRLLDARWPEEAAALLAQQIREPEEERRLRPAIARLTAIDDEVSLRVQQQYEENPYPRWLKDAPRKPLAVNTALRRILPLAPLQPLGSSDRPDVLVAGCGTGQHAIGTAQSFEGAKVLAVDLSGASLAYAARKTREMGVTSIEYAQADLLKLGAIGRSFDVIESVGVLHHLADPWAGWRVLLQLLRPRGVMKLGFYSQVARRNVNKARAVIAERGYAATADGIRQCRQDLMAMGDAADFGALLQASDFFSTSACRDLLFHVQEQQLTLDAIHAFLRENRLRFLGFEGNVNLQAYRQRYPEDRAAIDLGQWQRFESEHPDTFNRMYQFWVQKAD